MLRGDGAAERRGAAAAGCCVKAPSCWPSGCDRASHVAERLIEASKTYTRASFILTCQVVGSSASRGDGAAEVEAVLRLREVDRANSADLPAVKRKRVHDGGTVLAVRTHAQSA